MVSPGELPLDERVEALERRAAEDGWRVTSRGGGGPSISLDLAKGKFVGTVVFLTPEALEASCPRQDERLYLGNDQFKVEPD